MKLLSLPKFTRRNGAIASLAAFVLALAFLPEAKFFLLGTLLGRIVTVLLVIAVTSVETWLGLLAVASIVYFFGMQEGIGMIDKDKVEAKRKEADKLRKEITDLQNQIAMKNGTIGNMRKPKEEREQAAKERDALLTEQNNKRDQLTKVLNLINLAIMTPLDAMYRTQLGETIGLSSDYYALKQYVATLKDGEVKDLANAELQQMAKQLQNYESSNKTMAESVAALNEVRESFDLIGAESSIKRGQQSKEVPVSSMARASNMAEPFVSAGRTVNGNASMFQAGYGR